MLVCVLNLHLEDSDLAECAATLEQFGLAQHVAEPTHLRESWLDVAVTRDDVVRLALEDSPSSLSDRGLVATISLHRA